MYLYSNIAGTFVLSQNFQVREKVLFSSKELPEVHSRLISGQSLKAEEEFENRFKTIRNLRKQPDPKAIEKVEEELKVFLPQLHQNNVILTRHQVRESMAKDQLIIQAVSTITELTKSSNLLTKRVREWYGFYFPEINEEVKDQKVFLELILAQDKAKLTARYKIADSMGAEFSKEDVSALLILARQALLLLQERDRIEIYLEKNMKAVCPNIDAIVGHMIGAKLLSIAGSLRNMVMMPSSTIQLLGAEKALFRHMINKNSRPPKHGIIHEHPVVQKAENKGRASRLLADKILLASKVDFFKGEFIGDKLKKELEEKL